MISRAEALELDATDPLAHCRDRFVIPDGLIYMDGNSLGMLGTGVVDRLIGVAHNEWGRDLIASWTTNGWLDAPTRIGDRIGGLIGAASGQVVVGDSTSVCLFKLLVAGARMRPDRRVLLTQAGNFPTDLYLIDSVAELLGLTVRHVTAEEISGAMTSDVGLVALTHINYRDGAMLDMEGSTEAAHAAGAVVLWDLSHSAGAMPVALDDCGADLAVGCGYKFLNGGPGAPAYSYVAARHQATLRQPLTGWLGHADPFKMADDYEPAAGIGRAIVGTPAMLSLVALDAALDAFDGVDMGDVRRKSLALGDLFIELLDDQADGRGMESISPRDPSLRGSQVAFRHPRAKELVAALAARRVVGDYREPQIARFGLTPLTLRYVDVWDAASAIKEWLDSWKFSATSLSG